MTRLKMALLGLTCALLVAGCSFLSTDRKDMEAAENLAQNPPEGAGYYETYSKERFEELWGVQKFVLFFHADWCPICRSLEARIKEDLSLLNGHFLLEVNYDEASELKSEYQVTTQSTVIFFDENGMVFDSRINPDLHLIENFFKI